MNSFQAYLIGLAQTDGHLSKFSRNRGRFTLELQYDDLDILKKIATNLTCNFTIGDRVRDTNFSKNYHSAYIRIYDLEFRKFLELNGVPDGNKSNIVRSPFQCDHPLANDYLRGLIDGDGSLGISSDNKPFLGFVTFSPYLKDFFVEWVELNTNRKFHKVNRTSRDNIFQPIVYNENAKIAIEKIYYPDCIALIRKLKKAEEVVQWTRPENIKKIDFKRTPWETWEDEIILSYSPTEASKKLNRTIKSVSCRKVRLKKKLTLETQSVILKQ